MSLTFIRLLLMFLGVWLTSFFLFPVGLGAANTKLIMAVVGIPVILYNAVKKGISEFNRNLILLFVLATGVSLASWLAVVINGTNDMTYVSYILSMLVWFAGAYTLVLYLGQLHENLDVHKICWYLVAACTMQCFLALLIDNFSGVENFFVRLHLLNPAETSSIREGDRLYGIGCAYDPAGLRFAAVLVIAWYFVKDVVDTSSKWIIITYLACIFVILVIGSMISRTTGVGFILGMVYFFAKSGLFKLYFDNGSLRSLKWVCWAFIIGSAVITAYYITDASFRKDFRFGFEGFVSLYEEGEWNVSSNDRLKTMYRWPDSLHTWVIGDGYFDSTDNDPYYVGRRWNGYYMATDVGYLRFIYYGGLVMLLSFMTFMYWSAYTCGAYFPKSKSLFYWLFILQLIIWLKVSTDIFCVFAIFLALGLWSRMEGRLLIDN